MVTINGLTGGVSIPPPNNSSTSGVDNTFGDALQKVLEKSEETETTGSQLLSEISQTSVQTIYDPVEEFTDMTTDLIDKLEAYAEDLEDPDKSLKDLEPQIQQIIDEAESLMKKAKKGTVKNDGLLKIAEETAMTANQEYVRYNRGDYI